MFECLEQAKLPVLWWNGSPRSTLVLALLREQPRNFDIVSFRDHWSRTRIAYCDALITRWNLKVFSYPASRVSFIGNDNGIQTVFEIAIADGQMPLVKDISEGTRCIADLDGPRSSEAPIPWDVHITGSPVYRSYAPIAGWTDEQVDHLLTSRDVELFDGRDTVSLCTNCLDGGVATCWCPAENQYIEPIQWDEALNTRRFQASYA